MPENEFVEFKMRAGNSEDSASLTKIADEPVSRKTKRIDGGSSS